MIDSIIGYKRMEVAVERITIIALFISVTAILTYLAVVSLQLYGINYKLPTIAFIMTLLMCSFAVLRNRFLKVKRNTKIKIFVSILLSFILLALL
jgi:hypothetical protein